MTSELQRLVDGLGRRLDRSVAIDDRQIRLLVHTSHRAEVDEARIASVMQRSVPDELVRYIHGIGALEATDFFVLPPQPELALSIERIGFPIRYNDVVLGFLWLLRSEGEVSGEDAEAARQAADQAAREMHREHLLGEVSRGRKRELLRDLLSSEPRLHREAAEQLIEEELVTAGPVTVIVVTVAHEKDQPLEEKDRLAIASALERARQPLSPRTAIQLERPDHGILVVVRPGGRREDDRVADILRREVCAETGRPAQECHVGIGGERKGLVDARASYLEAKRAAEVAAVVTTLGPVIRYSRLGVYALLAELPPERLSRNIHPGLRRLLESDADADSLVRTLEVFLNTAGNVKQTAAELCVHRATVYYRIDRIEKIADVRLSNGDDRLALHIGLKVARLIGLRQDSDRA